MSDSSDSDVNVPEGQLPSNVTPTTSKQARNKSRTARALAAFRNQFSKKTPERIYASNTPTDPEDTQKSSDKSRPSLRLVGSPRHNQSSSSSESTGNQSGQGSSQAAASTRTSRKSKGRGSNDSFHTGEEDNSEKRNTCLRDISPDRLRAEYGEAEEIEYVESSTDNQDKTAKKTLKAPNTEDKGTLKLISNLKRRTDQAKLRGATLQKKAKEFNILTGGKVFLKAEYKSLLGKRYTFEFGELFHTREEKKSPISADMVKAIDEAFAKNFKKHMGNKTNVTPISRPVSETPKGGIFSRRSARPNKGCAICGQEDDDCVEITDYKGNVTDKISTHVLACSFKIEEKDDYCPRMVHAYCLGFPKVTDKTIDRMPDWFCKTHVLASRNLSKRKKPASKSKKVVEESENEEESEESSSEPSANTRSKSAKQKQKQTKNTKKAKKK